MNQQPLTSAPSLRFRRWSRKAYAAFVSVGRHVTIGCVHKGIADRSLAKQTGTGIPLYRAGILLKSFRRVLPFSWLALQPAHAKSLTPKRQCYDPERTENPCPLRRTHHSR